MLVFGSVMGIIALAVAMTGVLGDRWWVIALAIAVFVLVGVGVVRGNRESAALERKDKEDSGVLEIIDWDTAVAESLPDMLDFFGVPEQVAFTSHYPREVAPRVWDRLLVFVALDTAEATAQVEVMAVERLLQGPDDARTATAPTRTALSRQTQLTIAPSLPGVHFEPEAITAEWTGGVQCYEFRLRAEDASPSRAASGQITILEGPLLRGEIPLSVWVRQARQSKPDWGHFTDERVAAYRDTFASYSPRDESIARACATMAEASGDRYLHNVLQQRDGGDWDPQLLELIDQADVFQLFWSKHAAASSDVEREWRHALTLRPTRPNFVRLVYWTKKPFPIPSELQPTQLGHLDPALLGLARPSWLGRTRRVEGQDRDGTSLPHSRRARSRR
jgi:hypothetical protein